MRRFLRRALFCPLTGLFWLLARLLYIVGRLTRSRGILLFTLRHAAATAFALGALNLAQRRAGELLLLAESLPAPRLQDPEYCEAVHQGHILLGRVFLRKGDVTSAARELLAAGRTSRSPTLISFGPNMRLARDLLAAGEREAVLEYLELCGRFWQLGAESLPHWSEEIRCGRTPDFGPNLFYH